VTTRPLAPAAWALAAAALFGASTPLSKALLASVAPLSLAGLLYLGAAVAVLPFAVGSGRAWRRRRRVNQLRLLGAVLFGGALAPVLLLSGLSLAPAGSVALWLALEAPMTAVLAQLFFREHLDRRAWLAVGLTGAAGVLLAAPEGFGTAPAAVLVALACSCWGFDNNLTAMIDDLTPAQITLVKGAVAGSVNVALGWWLGNAMPAAPVSGGALLVGAASYGASLALYIRAAQQLGAARSQMIFATAPAWGVTLAWTALAEPVQPEQVAAGALMLIALAALYSERHSHAHTHEPTIHMHWHRHDDGFHDHAHVGISSRMWHTHQHAHAAVTHAHEHRPDLHHRHEHDSGGGGADAERSKHMHRSATPAAATHGHVIRWAGLYDWVVAVLSLGRDRALRRMTVELAHIEPGARVLDVGCGTGSVTIAAGERAGATGEVHGIDPAPEMIDAASRKAARAGVPVRFQVGVIERLPFADAYFDVVLSSLMLHHLPDDLKRAGLAEVRRVLKPGGRLVAVDFAPPANPLLRHLVTLLLGHGMAHTDIRHSAVIVTEVGFTDVQVRATSFRLVESLCACRA
jgi:ubiquinone/menaquinone biosynthesis C-methylase UbiE/drug/metabolite transporter (DMT)-like permease